jgi:signal transduction histidine kinase
LSDPKGNALPRRWRSLRLRILVWALPAVASLLLAVVVVDTFAYRWVVTFVAEQRDQEIARASASRLAEDMLKQAEGLTSIASMLSIRPGDASSRAVALAELVISNPELFTDRVTLFDEQGRVITSQPRQPLLQGRTLNSRQFFRAAIADTGPAFSDVVEEESTGTPTVVLAVPVRSPAGHLHGVLSRHFRLDGRTLASMVPHLGTDRPGAIYVLDRTGRVIYHPEERLINQQLPTDSPIIKAVMQEESGARLVNLPYGEPQVVGYATVPQIGWHLVLQEPLEATISPLRTYLWLGSGALLSGVVLSIAAILWGARHISTPVDDLVRQAEAAVESNYTTRVQSESISELERLAAAFNHMIEQIERYRAGLRRYVAAITHSQEEERRRIARELHDDTIQSLVAMGRQLELIEASLANPEETLQQLSGLRALLQETIEGVRRFSRELRPTLLEDLGLIPALRRLVRDLIPDGVKASIVVEGDPREIDTDTELALYRIAQEAINNVRRHAQAHHLEARLHLDSELIHLCIEDDGQGFEVSANLSELAQRGSFGLMGIQERAELLGGRMVIHSQAGRGTRLEVWLPHSGKPPAVH